MQTFKELPFFQGFAVHGEVPGEKLITPVTLFLSYAVPSSFLSMTHAAEDPAYLTSESTQVWATGNAASWFKINLGERGGQREFWTMNFPQSQDFLTTSFGSLAIGGRRMTQRNKNQHVFYGNHVVVASCDCVGLRLFACPHWLATRYIHTVQKSLLTEKIKEKTTDCNKME